MGSTRTKLCVSLHNQLKLIEKLAFALFSPCKNLNKFEFSMSNRYNQGRFCNKNYSRLIIE
jgi:hypothetical protein